ncbi:unnamed protein product [Urochloa humidicola]
MRMPGSPMRMCEDPESLSSPVTGHPNPRLAGGWGRRLAFAGRGRAPTPSRRLRRVRATASHRGSCAGQQSVSDSPPLRSSPDPLSVSPSEPTASQQTRKSKSWERGRLGKRRGSLASLKPSN